jgi:REP element-mobilizing transposase RayT
MKKNGLHFINNDLKDGTYYEGGVHLRKGDKYMNFYENQYYHLYNRTNNEEALFRSDENYLFFLKKYRFYLDEYLDTIGYCLMPTHFHFLVRVKEVGKDGLHLGSNDLKEGNYFEGGVHLNPKLQDRLHFRNKDFKEEVYPEGGVHLSRIISDKIGILLSSYTKSFNKRFNRHGSLFQEHSKAKPISDDRYLIYLLIYIHQNPIRSGLVEKAEEWKYSSYQDYIDFRKGTLPKKDIILDMIKTNELRELTEMRLMEIEKS